MPGIRNLPAASMRSGAVGGNSFGLRRDRGDPFALDQHLARKGRRARTIPHHGAVNQQAHRFLQLACLARHHSAVRVLFCVPGLRNSVARRRRGA